MEQRKGLDDLIYFSRICGFSDVDYKVHNIISDVIEKRQYKRMLFLLPRGSFKSSLVTISYSIQSIVKNPDIRILVDNEVFGNAVKFVGIIKNVFENNIKFRYLYGDFVPKKAEGKWTESQFTVKKRKKPLKEPTVTAGGIGATQVGMHYDLIIGDDLVSDQNILTKEQKEKVIAHYKLLFSLLDPDGILIIIGTRWAYDDLYGYILENEKSLYSDGNAIIIEKAIREDNSLFFPKRLTKEFLSDMRITQGEYIFSCQYQNDPVDRDTATFKQEWIKYFTDKPDGLYITMTVDPAIGTGHRADETAFVVCGHNSKGDIFVLQTFNDRIDITKTINKIFEYAEFFHPNAIGLEVVAYQKALKYVLVEEMRKRNIYLPIVELKTDTRQTKEMRISALAPKFEFGCVYLRKEQTSLIEQLLKFPYTSHDDLIDALAYTLQLARHGKEKKILQVDGHLTFRGIMNRIKMAKKIIGNMGNEGITFDEAYRQV